MRQNLRATAWLAALILAFTIAVSAVGFWTYSHYRYGGMDLAIYTNVLHQLAFSPSLGELEGVRGKLEGLGAVDSWYSSIQGGSYLGDHVEPILLLIAPLFRLWSDPRLLLILQALALGLTAIPVFLLLSLTFSQRRENDERRGMRSIGTVDDRAGMVPPQCPRSGLWAGSEGGIGASEHAGRASVPEGARPTSARCSTAVLLTSLWLLNPILWNAALFEFHALAFAPLFLLSAAYAYVRRRFWWFFLFLLLSLSVREDVALIVVMFGVAEIFRCRTTVNGVAARIVQRFRQTVPDVAVQRQRYEQRNGLPTNEAGFDPSWRWIVLPVVLGLSWFLLAIRIAGTHSASGGYKFSVYYGWLAHAGPIDVVRHLASIGNLDMVLGLLLPFLFLPILRLRWLVLAIPPLFQILLSEPGGSNVVVELHYGLLFLPALALASIAAITSWQRAGAGSNQTTIVGRFEPPRDVSPAVRWFAHHVPLPRRVAIGLGIAVYLAAAWMLGPFPGIASVVVYGASSEDRARRAAYDDLLARVPSDAPVAVGYAALPHVAARRGAYALPYAYLGVNQYAFAPYQLPDDTRYLLLDQRDAVAYGVQFPEVRWSAPHAASGPDRLRANLERGRFGVLAERGGVALLERNGPSERAEHVEGLPRGLDSQYFEPSQPVRGRLVIDGLRDTVVKFDTE